MITWTTGEMTIQVGHLIVRKQALMLPTNDTGSVIIQKNVEKKSLLRNKTARLGISQICYLSFFY